MTNIALVTGAAQGIGLAIAKSLVSTGYKVFCTSRREVESDEITYMQMNLLNTQSILECAKQITDLGRLDVLINNAGNAIVGPLEKTSADDLRKQFEVNLFGIHTLITSLLPLLKESNGKIINIGSFGGRLALPYQVLYSSSKAALSIYTDGLRMELKQVGVEVSLIEPGDTHTNFDAGRIKAYKYNESEDPEAERAIRIMRESESKGVDPKVVVKAVMNAIKKNNPKPRYTTGPDAKLFGILQRFLPFTLQERLIMIMYKVPRK
ncbi:MAG: SDR family oxidoreductase [Candidatus Heimdallarchaeota archaeon]|nr:SDR family oxidoreductase [Candidatus Heimdallarchaeota archaeon]